MQKAFAVTVSRAVTAAEPWSTAALKGHHFEGHDFDGHHFAGHDFDRRHFEGHGFWLGPVFPYYPPVYSPNQVARATGTTARATARTTRAVTSCPEPWETVPAE